MKVKARPDPITGEVDAVQFVDDGKDEWNGRQVFRDAKSAYVQAGADYVRAGDFLLTLGDGTFKGMTAEEFYKTYDAEPASPPPAPAAKAAAAQLAKDEEAADEYGKAQSKKK